MGSWDCYCAICAGALVAWSVHTGSTSPRALRLRAERLKVELERRRTGEHIASPGESEYEDAGDEHGEERLDKYEELSSYDPNLVDKNDVKWLEVTRCLGYNVASTAVDKTFISGIGSYVDYGSFEVEEHGGDPNDPGDLYTCYATMGSGESPVFPFHEACWEILRRAIHDRTGGAQMSKDVLYDVMHELTPDYGGQLEIAYGDMTTGEQVYSCTPGEEYAAYCPAFNPKVTELLREIVLQDDFAKPSSNIDLSRRIHNDPLSILPYDLVYLIFEYLPQATSTIALLNASPHVFNITRNNAFWKQCIRRLILPFFWELESLYDDLREDVDCKRLFLFLEKSTRPTLGLTGPFLGVANRRRILTTCTEELIPRYWSRLEWNPLPSVNAIMEQSTSTQMLQVLHPPPTRMRTMTTQWIKEWYEIDSDASTFRTTWNTDGTLVGLTATFAGDDRSFAQPWFGRSHHSIQIQADDWIQSFILHFPRIKKMDSETQTGIQGLTVVLKSGRTEQLGMTPPDADQRVLTTSPGLGTYIVGVTGHIAGDGLISRLGLVQCRRPSNDGQSYADSLTDSDDLPQAYDLLWNHHATTLPTRNGVAGVTAPIWSHPDLRMLPLRLHVRSAARAADMLPHQVLLWASNESELQDLTNVSAHVVKGSYGVNSDARVYTQDVCHIIGLRTSYAPFSSIPTRTVVNDEDESSSTSWKRENTIPFEIDGPGGEIITEFHMPRETDLQAFKLRTNLGREICFGRTAWEQWEVQRVDDGDVMVGLVVCFGSRSHMQHEGVRSYTHCRTSRVGPIVMSKQQQ